MNSLKGFCFPGVFMKNTTSIFCLLCCALFSYSLKAQSFSFSSKKPYTDKAKISHEKKALIQTNDEYKKEESSRKIASMAPVQSEEEMKQDIKNTVIFNKTKK